MFKMFFKETTGKKVSPFHQNLLEILEKKTTKIKLYEFFTTMIKLRLKREYKVLSFYLKNIGKKRKMSN